MVNRERMVAQLILHEGLKLKPYQDTEGNTTVLIGYNVDARGWDFIEDVVGHRGPFTEDDAVAVCLADIDRIEHAIPTLFPKYAELSEVRQRVVLDMVFNMQRRALNFKRARKAIEEERWSDAVRELYASRWSHQVGDGKSPEDGGRFGREDRLARMLLTGNDYTS